VNVDDGRQIAITNEDRYWIRGHTGVEADQTLDGWSSNVCWRMPCPCMDFGAVPTIPIEKISNHVASCPYHHTYRAVPYLHIFRAVWRNINLEAFANDGGALSLSLTPPLHGKSAQRQLRL